MMLVLLISLLIVRVATVALTLTGMSRPLARFQARSAFTGAGFTTSESESVVNHPVRRRIITWLILLGNAGIVTVLASVILSVVTADQQADSWTQSLWVRLGGIVIVAVMVWVIGMSARFDRFMTRWIQWALRRWTEVDVRDFNALLHLSGDYGVMELHVKKGDWIAGRQLKDLRLASEGVLVLGIQRTTGKYIGAPRGQTTVEAGDDLLVYGRSERLSELDRRPTGSEGSRKHVDAVVDQANVRREETDETEQG